MTNRYEKWPYFKGNTFPETFQGIAPENSKSTKRKDHLPSIHFQGRFVSFIKPTIVGIHLSFQGFLGPLKIQFILRIQWVFFVFLTHYLITWTVDCYYHGNPRESFIFRGCFTRPFSQPYKQNHHFWTMGFQDPKVLRLENHAWKITDFGQIKTT